MSIPHAKRVKTNKRRTLSNRADRSALRTTLKKVNAAVESKEAEAIKTSLQPALSMIGRACRKGLIHKNKAARQESRLMKKINALKQN